MQENSSPVQIVVSKDKPFLEGNLIKTIVYFIISSLIVYLNFVYENRELSPEIVQTNIFEGTFFSGKDNIIPDNGIIRVEENVLISGVEGLTKEADEIIKTDEVLKPALGLTTIFKKDNNEYAFKFSNGHMWANFLISNAKVNILAENLVLIPKNAVFDLVYDGSTATLNVINGDVYAGFLSPGIELTEYQNEYSDIFINRLLIPKSSQATFNISKINESLRPLLFSKLAKEFKLSAVLSEFKKSDWVIQNLSKDNLYIINYKQNLRSEITAKGVTPTDKFFDDMVFWAEENLTYIPSKKENIVFKHLFAYLDNAIFYANIGDTGNRDISFMAFDGYLNTLPENISKGEKYYKTFDSYVSKFSIFNQNEDLFYIWETLYAKNLMQMRNVRNYLNRLWVEVYVSIDNKFLNTDLALKKYFRFLENNLTDVTFTEIQNQLFDNLFLRYSYFYKNDFFAMKAFLENKLIMMLPDGQIKNEIRQAFINNKIDFLKRLRVFFFNNEISVEDAKQIITRLDSEILDLMPSKDSNVAVIALFESQLKDLDEFWAYLKDTEYNSSIQYGATHEERYKTFLADRKLLSSIGAMFEDITGNEVQTKPTSAEIEIEIKNVFAQYPQIKDLELGEIDSEERFVDIKANFGGYPIKAKYDRISESLKDIYSGEDLISDRSIKIASLLPILIDKYADLAEETLETPEETEERIETHAQRIARNYIANQISKVGFDVPNEKVKIVDEENAIYRVSEIYYKDIPEIVITFDYVASSEKNVKNLYMIIRGKPVNFDKTYTLEEVRDMVLSEKDFAETTPEFIDVTQ